MADHALLGELNLDQKRAATTTEGPVLVIAGPGSGKTLTMIRRTLAIIESGKAKPEEIVLCTFTEKAALEIRDRLARDAARFDVKADLSGLITGTIHGVAKEFLEKYSLETELGKNFDVLDPLAQKLFINEHFREIVGERDGDGLYLAQWKSKWGTIGEVVKYFDKIAEETIDSTKVSKSKDPFRRELGKAYLRYRKELKERNRIDFAHLQLFFLEMMRQKGVGDKIKKTIKYVMVDEYQDTNYIQEQMILELGNGCGNICVVGDEDQALYRFRGATVRNILEFPSAQKKTTQVVMTTNYRSHPSIVSAYDAFMSAHDWSSDDARVFRFDKQIRPDLSRPHPNVDSVLKITGKTKEKEAEAFADFVEYMKSNGIIDDYSQVALLLRSVKEGTSGPYMQALAKKGIKYFCPRAGKYFDGVEIMTLVGSFAIILGFDDEDNRGGEPNHRNRAFHGYVDECVDYVRSHWAGQPLIKKLEALAAEIAGLKEGQNLDTRLADYVYALLPFEPFAGYLRDENKSRHVAIFTQLIGTFQRFYGYPVITSAKLNSLRNSFFNSFLVLLFEDGLNEYEDDDRPFPKGHVQILTIHQSKGLEFPVVAVGGLSKNSSVSRKIDQTLGDYYVRDSYEDSGRIGEFDAMRMYYVAFSRAQNFLVLLSSDDEKVKPRFKGILAKAVEWTKVDKEPINDLHLEDRPRADLKKAYSFTGDIKVYETCPRQYEMYKKLEFQPSRAAMVVFGLVVHQTIEDIHRTVLNGDRKKVTDEFIENRFQFNYRHLSEREARQLGQQQLDAARQQVFRYWKENQEEISRVRETEVDVSLEKDGYILSGAIDLVSGDDGELEILDFKAQKKPSAGAAIIDSYYKQLCIYAHILEQRGKGVPKRLVIYWTGEESKADAIMEFPYVAGDVATAMQHFDSVVDSIKREDFSVIEVPGEKVCDECDFKPLCTSDGTLKGSRAPKTRGGRSK